MTPALLSEVLAKAPPGIVDPNLLVGNESSDDAAVYRLNAEQALVATTDFFMPIVDDPYDFGRIAATNAISDVYAMGGKPILALALVGMPISVLSTATIWYVGIVAYNSDYAFTVTNVIIHGVPYFALIWFYAKTRRETGNRVYRTLAHNWLIFLATLWAFAYVEELFWGRGVWHERQWIFGADWDWAEWKAWLIPLLAVPQLTHYILDGFIWRRRGNANLSVAKNT